MVQFTKSTNSFMVEFTENELYLDNGKVSMPTNSLSLTIDDSDIAVFRRASNNDVFFSGLIENCEFDGTQATKSTIGGLFQETCTSAVGGADPETTVTDVEISEDGTEMDFVNASGDTVYSVDMTQYLVDLHVTGASLSGESLTLYIAGGDPVVVDLSGMMDDYYTSSETDTLLAEKLDTSAFTSAEEAIALAISNLNDDTSELSGSVASISNGLSAYTLQSNFESAEQAIANAISDIYDDIVELSAHTATTLVAGDNITISGDVISSNQVIELTQAEYDALSGDVDPSKLYVITDAPSADLSNYTLTSTTAALSGQVMTISGQVTANTASLSNKQDTLTAGSGITITNNVISAQADLSNYYDKTSIDNAEQATSAALNDLNLRIIELSGTVATKAEVLRMTTQEYQTSSGTVQSNQLVIITDAQAVDMSNYYTKAEIDAMLQNL